MRRGQRGNDKGMAMRDLLFNLSLLFAVLMIMALLLISNGDKNPVERPAEYLITTTWADDSKVDVDTHLLYNNDKWIYYAKKESGHIHLERDDLGQLNDTYTDANGVSKIIKLNREVITVRDKADGIYVVNVFAYRADKIDLPVKVDIELLQLTPYKILAKKSVELLKTKQELSAFTFILKNEKIVDLDTKTFTPIVATKRILGPIHFSPLGPGSSQ